jgi:hypothetical protein
MGFECIYHYHERIDKDYNKEEIKTLKKKVGDPFEDISLEKLAIVVMSQLARRDIWIVDVEIFELSKKQISFKESKGGIVIKNKKFIFDENEDFSSLIKQDIVSTPASVPQKSINISGQSNISVSQEQNNSRVPIEWVVFSPELPQMHEIKQNNLRFTQDKKYPVFHKKESVNGYIFSMFDDTGREQLVSEKYFIPANINLLGDKQLGFSQDISQKDEPKLYWGGVNNENNMIDIRRKK